MSSPISTDSVAHLIDPEHVETIDVLGPTIQFLTPLEDDGAPCVMRGAIPPGVSIPLHSHADPETFMMMSGTVDGLVVDRETDLSLVKIHPGEMFHVPGNAKHGFRNQGSVPAVMIMISTARIGRFFKEVGKPARAGTAAASPSQNELEHFMKTSERYGYWNATPAENARVGIAVG